MGMATIYAIHQAKQFTDRTTMGLPSTNLAH